MPLTVGLDGGSVHSCTQTSRKDGWDGVELEPQLDEHTIGNAPR
jgi:hypothetical protein